MYLKSYGLVFAIVTLFQCSYGAEITRNASPEAQLLAVILQQPPNLQGLQSALASREAVQVVINEILKAQGTSLAQINERILESKGNLESLIDGINKELRIEVFVIEGDLVKINVKSVEALIVGSIQSIAKARFAGNPLLGLVLAEVITQQVKSRTPELERVFGSCGIPVEAAREVAGLVGALHHPRAKRDIAGGIIDVIVETVLVIFRGQISAAIKPVKLNLDYAIGNATDSLLKGYISMAPANDLESIVAFAKNTIIRRLVEILSEAQNIVDQTLGKFVIEDTPAVVVQAAEEATSRKRRDVEAQNVEVQQLQIGNYGILDVILNPIRAILGVILRPINELAKAIVESILRWLVPIIGNAVLSPVRNLIYGLIDMFIPAFQ